MISNTKNNCVVYQDGKLGRGRPGTIIKNESIRILIEFSIDEYNEEKEAWIPTTKPRWFNKKYRESGGAYECIDWNYWYYRRPRGME